MQNFDVQFDRELGLIRMARADCSPHGEEKFESLYQIQKTSPLGDNEDLLALKMSEVEEITIDLSI